MSRRIVLDQWPVLRADAARVRSAVFIDEQGIRDEDEWDAADAGALHAVAYDGQGAGATALGTARLLPDGRIGRVAVLAPWRRRGIGGALIEALVAAARGRGMREVTLSAQRSAEPFYLRHGFVAAGASFTEVGIEHVPMRRVLSAEA